MVVCLGKSIPDTFFPDRSHGHVTDYIIQHVAPKGPNFRRTTKVQN
jgi:hypothetical protein